ncbi:MAG: hypothetical protein ACPGVD_07960 [Flavobacteriales bacterium]
MKNDKKNKLTLNKETLSNTNMESVMGGKTMVIGLTTHETISERMVRNKSRDTKCDLIRKK